MPYTIAISNEKGGVAKTTTSLSLGAALAELGHQVLLVDLDAQANLSLALGFEPAGTSLSSGDMLLEAAPLQSVLRQTDIPGLDLVPSNSKIGRAEQLLPIHLSFRERLNDTIQDAAPLPHDFIIIDCPPSLGSVTLNALHTANLLLIPTQAEYFSAYALRDMMALIRQVRQDGNPTLAYRILITMLDKRNRAHRNIREQLKNTFGEGLFENIIEIDTKLRESPILGLPIMHYKSNSRGSQQYRELAQELLVYVKETTNQQTAR